MREIGAERITETVKRLCIEANCHLTCDVKDCIKSCYQKEDWPQAKEILGMRLAVMHNLYFYNNLMQKIRDALDNDTFDEFYANNVDKLDTRI